MIGFVYILVNEYFAEGVYKVGCTERAPHARAAELSKGTAIPAAFQVLCYLEVDNFQQVEGDLHQWLKKFRISDSREFFEGGIEHAIAWLWWHPKSLGLHGVTTGKPHSVPSFMHDLIERELVSPPNGDVASWSLHDLPNPWPDDGVKAAPIADVEYPDDFPWETPSPDLKVVGGTSL